MVQCRTRQQMKRATAIGERSADGWKRSVRTDEAFLHGGVTPRALLDTHGEVLPRLTVITKHIEHIEEHRMDHEAVVVIPMKFGTVAVGTIALVPLVELPQRVVDAQLVR